MVALCSGIEVPKSIDVPMEDYQNTDHEIVSIGETYERFLSRGIALCAFWDMLLRKNDFDRSFKLEIFSTHQQNIKLFSPDSPDFNDNTDQEQHV